MGDDVQIGEVIPAAQARDHMERFILEIEEICKRYGLHGMTYTAVLKIEPAADDPTKSDIISTSLLGGCEEHTIICLARFIFNQLPEHQRKMFIKVATDISVHDMIVAGLQTMAISDAPPEPAKPSGEDLLNMPMPKGAKCN